MKIVSLFYDYIDKDDVNIIKDWLDMQDVKVKAAVNARLNVLENIERAEWQMPWTEVLSRDKDGLIAIRVKSNRVQYRLLGYDGPYRGEFTLLACCIEKNNKYIPLDIGKQANSRKTIVQGNPENRRVRHDFR